MEFQVFLRSAYRHRRHSLCAKPRNSAHPGQIRPLFSSACHQRRHSLCAKPRKSAHPGQILPLISSACHQQALTLRKTSKFGYIQASPALAAQSSPAQPSSAQSSPVQPSPRQAPGCPSASQPASQLPNRGIRRGHKLRPRQSGESGKPGVRPATCSKIQNSCRVIAKFSSGKSPAPPPPPGAQSAPPPTSSPSPKATGYESLASRV